MKVSCLTFHDSSNYGTVLQAYALQTVVTRMGHDYEIINYSNAEKRKHDTLLGRNRELSLPFYLYKLLNVPQNFCKQLKFQRFRQNYLHTTPRFYSFEELRQYAAYRDAIMVGSDQVWNYWMIRMDPAYFLKFTDPAKKIAYAASIGISKVTAEEEKFYQEMLSDFDRIAVREQTAAQLIGEMTSKHAQVVLDPTLLLTREDWKTIAAPSLKKPYIFAYILEHNPPAQAFLKKLQKQTGLPVRYVSRGIISALRDGATRIPSPQEWISQMLYAKYVVTSSFHGTAFATNFHKTFFTLIEGDATQSRQVDFLRSTGLESRLNPSFSGEISLETPDFSMADKFLKEKRIEAETYLKKSLAAVREETVHGTLSDGN